MMSVTHATIAAAGASLILGSADPIVLGLAILGSQLPDLDTTTSAIVVPAEPGNRTLTVTVKLAATDELKVREGDWVMVGQIITDLQVKLAEIENKRGDLTAKLRETMVLQVLEFDQIRREFQIAQEIAQREAPRMKVYTFEYQVGGSTTGDYLGRMSALDRQKAEVFRQWAKLRTQLARVKLLMLGAGEE